MNLQITRDTISGIIDVDEDTKLSFTEWWNGEGIDLHFNGDGEFSVWEMSKDDLSAICTLAIYLGFVDEKTLKENIESFRTQEKNPKLIKGKLC